MKIGIIGAGAVGSACLLSVVMRASAREVVLVNRNRKKAQGVITDIQYASTLFRSGRRICRYDLRSAQFRGNDAKAWFCLSRHRRTPAQPSTRHD
jgi:malate/lactate dehydrogenase